MDKFSRGGDMHGFGSTKAHLHLLNTQSGRRDNDASGSGTKLEYGDTIPAESVGFGRVLSLANAEIGTLVMATVALLISSTSNILVNMFGGKIIDIVTRNLDTVEQKSIAFEEVQATITYISLIVVISSICTALRAWLFCSASERIVARLKNNLFSHLVHQEIAFFDATHTGELLSRHSEDTQIIKDTATTNVPEGLRNLFSAFIGLGFMLATSWKLTMLALLVVPAVSVAIRKFGRYLRELSHKTQAAAAGSSSIAELLILVLEETFGAICTVRSFAQEGYEISRYSVKVEKTLQLGLKQAELVGIFPGCVKATSKLSMIVVVIYGATLAIQGTMTPGSLTSFILYSLTVGSSVSDLSSLYTVIMKAAGASYSSVSDLGSHVDHASIRRQVSLGCSRCRSGTGSCLL